ncbi:hypothetical protein JCM33374_g4034 [Metschnikowia sp. JCM 33374]|nr:hypothetical protein JCM33374_g4034 [Metschnikowia sp. JCM 33374]
MPKNNEPHVLSIARCKRIVRPLLSKVHSLTDLHSKYPVKVNFDTILFTSGPDTPEKAKFNNPATSQDRLNSLKPYLAQETYDAYTEIFAIFKNIVSTLYPGEIPGARRVKRENGKMPRKTPQKKPHNGSAQPPSPKTPRLSFLAAQKLGKSIALGTKSTHYSLNQTALFDPDSIPLYLRKYHQQLAEDIDEWLAMEPASVVGHHRADLLLGYVLHILVFNSRTLLYTFIPVVCHWLHEQRLPSSRSLFIECWNFSPLDPDHEEVQDLTGTSTGTGPGSGVGSDSDANRATFWLFHNIGYWHNLVVLLGVKSSEYLSAQSYDALFLEALVSCDRLSLDHIDVHEVYALMRNNPQHPKNTQVLVLVVAQLITSFRASYNTASTSSAAHEAISTCYHEIRHFTQTWLCLSKTCIFNSLDRGNEEIFEACFSFMAYLMDKCVSILEYLDGVSHSTAPNTPHNIAEITRSFQKLHIDITKLNVTCKILQGFFLDTQLPVLDESLTTPAMVRYFSSFVHEDSDEDTMDDFMAWVGDQESTESAKLVSLLRRQMASQ